MVQFEAQLCLNKKEIARNATVYGAMQASGPLLEWENGFIDYGGLKKSLKSLKHDVDEQSKVENLVLKRFQTGSSENFKKGKWDEQEGEFAKQLDAEVEKVLLFYLARQGELSNRILSVHQEARTLSEDIGVEGSLESSSFDDETQYSAIILGLREKLSDCERNMIHLLQFLRWNITGLRKILKKHDKQIRAQLLARNYLTSRAKDKYSSIYQVTDPSMISLVAILKHSLLAEETCENLTLNTATNHYYLWNHYQLIFSEGLLTLISSLKMTSKRIARMEQSMAKHLVSAQDEKGGYAALAERGSSQLEMNISLGLDSQDLFAKNCEEVALLQESRNRTISDYMYIPSGELLLEPGMHLDDMTEAESHAVLVKLKLDVASAYINLLYTFLYMSNYYIVAPIATHMAEKLHLDESTSGIIIGMTPIASCLSMILYSWWSNTSFKSPLLLCACFLMAGNLLCLMAVDYRSLAMLLMGRAFIGLGGPRVINRRYIADTVPLHDRTFFSAAFVASGSLGMATGPALAGVLSHTHFDMGEFGIVDELKAPSWIMLIAWAALGASTVSYFKEPEERVSPHGRRLSVSSKPNEKLCMNKDECTGIGNGVKSAGVSNDGKEDAEQLLVSVPSSIASGLDDEKDSSQDIKDIMPLMFCLSAYAVNKFVAEAVVCSTSIVTRNLFDWNVRNVGVFMAVLGLSALPLTIIIGSLSRITRDSTLLCTSAILSSSFCAVLLKLGDTYAEVKYIIGMIGIFLTLQCHEAVTMSITSKVIPHKLALGTFNSGFLATEIGTAARFVGDMLIVISGAVSAQLPNTIFIPCLTMYALLSITSLLVRPYCDV